MSVCCVLGFWPGFADVDFGSCLYPLFVLPLLFCIVTILLRLFCFVFHSLLYMHGGFTHTWDWGIDAGKCTIEHGIALMIRRYHELAVDG